MATGLDFENETMALTELVLYLMGVGILALEDFLFGGVVEKVNFFEFFDFVKLSTAGDQNS